mgnify:FL=1
MKFREIMCLGLLVSLSIAVAAAQTPPTVTIAQIQQYQGVNEGDRVRVVGVVTCESARFGYSTTMVSDFGGGAWGSIAVYDRDQRLVAERGNTVEVVGIIQEYYDKTEIVTSDETEFPPMVTGSGSVPEPLDISACDADNEDYESCLIMLRNVEVLSAPDQYGAIAISDGNCEFTLLLRKIDPVPSIGFVYACLIGIDDYHFGEFKIRPRDEGDWECPGGDPTPTPTQGTGPTPTPTPGGTHCDPTLQLSFDDHNPEICFQGGDMFEARFQIANLCEGDRSFDLYVVLEVAGLYFFWPSWTENMDSAPFQLRPEEQIDEAILPPFAWPSGVGSFNGLHFYGVMTVPDTYDLVGQVAMVEFCYQ